MRQSSDSELRWHFPDLDNGEADGLNHPMLQYFEGNYERYVARETIQNSIDARTDFEGKQSTVAVEFEYSEIPSKTIPGLAELRKRIDACLTQQKKTTKL